ncbi:DMT family transporter [Roseomonas sp. CCTCC AB2023176]|uniref:DMT family transporter n=1 Tax=Roseomonas sp. CCTCC AB2023176 TaxID=3342640 RepID=UPI0035E364D8
MTLPTTPRMSRGSWGLLLLLSVIWGGSFLFMAIAAPHLPAMTVVLARVAIAAPLLWAAAALTRMTAAPTRARVAAWAVMGFLNNALPISLIVWAQHFIPSGLSAIVQAATPLATALLAHVLTEDERITPAKAAGILIGIAGVAVLSGAGFGATRDELTGIGLMLAVCVLYGLANVWGRRFRRLGVAPYAAGAGQTGAAALMLLPLVLVFDRPWTLPVPPASVWFALAALGVVCTALAYALYFRILSQAGATNVALVTLLVPASAVVLGAVVLGEVLLPRHGIGMLLITAALILMDGRLTGRIRAR